MASWLRSDELLSILADANEGRPVITGENGHLYVSRMTAIGAMAAVAAAQAVRNGKRSNPSVNLSSAAVARDPATNGGEDRPAAETIIQAIALAKGKLPGHERYLTKYEMIALCQQWLKEG